ncbi:MAG: type II toxin-antitoxin system VapC family toxin [Acidimicrobiales bacterium]
MVVYIDSGPFIAYLRRKDRDHAVVCRRLVKLQDELDRVVTSDAVVAEVATGLRYDIGLDAVLAFRGLLDAFGRHLRIVESSVERRGLALDLMGQYADLRLSYVDCIGAIVARETKAAVVFSLDNDFRVLGFTVEP